MQNMLRTFWTFVSSTNPVLNKDVSRRDIGSKLVSEIIDYCRPKKIKELFVQADAVYDHAIKFFKKSVVNNLKFFTSLLLLFEKLGPRFLMIINGL